MTVLQQLTAGITPHLDSVREQLFQARQEIVQRLDRIADLTEGQQVQESFSSLLEGNDNTGAGNSATVTLRPSAGHDWLLSLITVIGGAGGGAAIYLNSVIESSVLFVVPDATFNSEILPNIPVPAGSTVLIHFYGQPANADCYVKLVAKTVAEVG